MDFIDQIMNMSIAEIYQFITTTGLAAVLALFWRTLKQKLIAMADLKLQQAQTKLYQEQLNSEREDHNKEVEKLNERINEIGNMLNGIVSINTIAYSNSNLSSGAKTAILEKLQEIQAKKEVIAITPKEIAKVVEIVKKETSEKAPSVLDELLKKQGA